jgi:hypothetical protein
MTTPNATAGNWRKAVLTPDRRAWMDQLKLVSAKVAGQMLGVTANRMRQMVREGKLRAALVDDGYCGSFIFRRADIARYAAAKQAINPTHRHGARKPCACGRACGRTVMGRRTVNQQCESAIREARRAPRHDLSEAEIDARHEQALVAIKARRTLAA